MFDTYEQKRYHKKRNLSSWGMHQLEIFYGKKSSVWFRLRSDRPWSSNMLVLWYIGLECLECMGWSGGAMVLGELPVPGRPTIWMIVGQGPIVLAVGAGGGCLDIFTLLYLFSSLSPSLWETARYRLKYCFKRPLNPKQPTNQLRMHVRD